MQGFEKREEIGRKSVQGFNKEEQFKNDDVCNVK